VGAHTITVICTDDSSATASASDDYILTVTNTNDAPTVACANSDASTAEDSAYSLDASGTCTDVDSGDTMAYTISGGPSTITISSGTISGTPLNADVGTHTITVTCTDGSSATATDSYDLTVTNTNDAPTVASAIADASTDEDAAHSHDISSNFADVDASDSLSFSATGMPTTLTMSTAGTMSGTPLNADVGVYTIVVTATDGTASVTDSYDLTVVNTDDATQGSAALDGDGSPWTESSTCTIADSPSSWSESTHCSVTITSVQQAVITTSGDSYSGSEGALVVDSTTYAIGTTVTLSTAGTYDVYLTDSWGDGGQSASISIQDGTAITTYVTISGDSYDDEVLIVDISFLIDDDGMGIFVY
jgi:hypothetical protein